jgi:hypothetical protein
MARHVRTRRRLSNKPRKNVPSDEVLGQLPKTITELLHDASLRECNEMLDCLLRKYNIEKGDYRSLARELAIEFVPGFRPAKFKLQHGNYGAVIRYRGKGGRRTEWTREKLDKLLNDVNDAKAEYGTDEEALHYITRRGKWGCALGRDPAKWRKTLKNILTTERKTQRCYADLLLRLARARVIPKTSDHLLMG